MALLTWLVEENSVQKEMYLGSYETTDAFEVNLKVVNNYLGATP